MLSYYSTKGTDRSQ